MTKEVKPQKETGKRIGDPGGAEEGVPVCGKCGNAKVMEDGEWVCPHCQGEIDFLGEDDD